jgi:FkbM family methyltransferase
MRHDLVVPVAGGASMTVNMAGIEGRMLATSGVWEPHTLAVLSWFLRPGDVFVDLGANIGFFSLFASTLVGSQGRVYAVEPAPETFSMLVANIERNHATNVIPQPLAAGATRGQAVLHDVIGEHLRGAATIARGPDERTDRATARPPVTVSVLSVREMVALEDLRRTRLIKVDVEGAELDVLNGLSEMYESGHARPSLAIEVHAANDADMPATVGAFVHRHDLRAYRVGDARDADRTASARRLHAARITPEQLARTSEDHFYVVVTDEELPVSAALDALAEESAR